MPAVGQGAGGEQVVRLHDLGVAADDGWTQGFSDVAGGTSQVVLAGVGLTLASPELDAEGLWSRRA